jgi:F0F1-type ATP synthase membrane subunit c/vacuolar-type H+-ATPase subunit K
LAGVELGAIGAAALEVLLEDDEAKVKVTEKFILEYAFLACTSG